MSAQDRRTARVEAAHAAAKGPAWRCKVTGCPQRDVWQPAPDVKAAHREADRHYDDRHADRPA